MIKLLYYAFVVHLLLASIDAELDLCGSDTIDLSYLNHATVWNLTHLYTKNASNGVIKTRSDYSISLCSPLKLGVTTDFKECDNKYICQNTHINDTQTIAGYSPSTIVELSETVKTRKVVFEGPICDEWDRQYNSTLEIQFTCGPRLEFPKLIAKFGCHIILTWRTIAACATKPTVKETLCYVYDDSGHLRDLAPLMKPNGGFYKVLSPINDEFYINVCSDANQICPQNVGACRRDDTKTLQSLADYRSFKLSFKKKSGAYAYDHIELVYTGKDTKGCQFNGTDAASKTTIRFRCPPAHQRRSISVNDRNPKLVSNLDCNYEIEWLSEYACPVEDLEVSANKCELLEDRHGTNFNLKLLLNKNINEQQFYKIDDIKLNSSANSSSYDIYFNVCGGLGDLKCNNTQWKTNAVCLKSQDGKYEKVIGAVDTGKLKYVDNRLLLEYITKEPTCNFSGNLITETTIIEFICDTQNETNSTVKPEFVSLNDCIYYIMWKTPFVCPVTSSLTSCAVSYKDNLFDLSLLRRNIDSSAWIASVTKSVPWSKHAKSAQDIIVLNICDSLPKNLNTSSCDDQSSACLLDNKSQTAVNLGKFTGSPTYNEDINAIELIYTDGFDSRTNKSITSKISLYCKPGNLETSPILMGIDESNGLYEFEWHTAAACAINTVVGNDCRVYDKFLGVTFDLNELKAKDFYPIKYKEYQFEINVCGPVMNSSCNSSSLKDANGPIGGCQAEINGDHRVWSLGRSHDSLVYWNGIINLTYTDGSPYRNKERTRRKSHIAFICDPNIGRGHPEFDGESQRSYFFRWYTSLACPHVPKIVHCVWDNGTHILDLSQLALTQGNHFVPGIAGQHVYYINICRPLNPIHGNQIKNCGLNSAACLVTLGTNGSKALSLGEPSQPPIGLFDGSINLLYINGDKCPNNSAKNISTRIKFICDPHGDSLSPTVIEPGSDEFDGEECTYLFEWRTAAVCNVISPTKVWDNSCVFTDNRTGLSVDLSPLKRTSSMKLYEVYLNQTKSKFAINVCGTANLGPTSSCANSAVCFQQNANNFTSYGSLESSSFFYDGNHLRLRNFNGSKCAHSNSGSMSTEIIFKCNPEAKQSTPKLHSNHMCLAVFTWETDLVCSLKLPQCSIVTDSNYYNLRQLSSVSHAWNTTDRDGNIYYLNICTKLPSSIGCNGLNAASCKCTRDNKNNLICDDLGDPSSHELNVTSNGSLILTYKNGNKNACDSSHESQTQITFKCGDKLGVPKFIRKTTVDCIYEFEWTTFAACPVNNRAETLLPAKNGLLRDDRIHSNIDIKPLISKIYNVQEIRDKDSYTYVIDFNKKKSSEGKCGNAIVCQTKKDFQRDIGSIGTTKHYIKGTEFHITLTSTSNTTCGKNKNKNVTTIFRIQCSSYQEIGEPSFFYETNNCDYFFNWHTSVVCPRNFVPISEHKDYENDENDEIGQTIKSSETDAVSSRGGHNYLWLGFLIFFLCLGSVIAFLLYHQRYRSNLRFRIRRLFTPESNQTFHYHQLATFEKERENEVSFISYSQPNSYSNTIAPQSSRRVPFSVCDDSDVDLLT